MYFTLYINLISFSIAKLGSNHFFVDSFRYYCLTVLSVTMEMFCIEHTWLVVTMLDEAALGISA